MNRSLSLRPCWRGKGEVWKNSYDIAFARSMFSWFIDAVSQFSETFCGTKLTRKKMNDFAVSLWFFIFFKYDGSRLFKMRHLTLDMTALSFKHALSQSLKLWHISSDITSCAGFKAVGFVTWCVSVDTFSYFIVFVVTKLITHQSQNFVDLSAFKELFYNICALSTFVSEKKKKKRINHSYRTWCDWRCSTFFRIYSRKSKPQRYLHRSHMLSTWTRRVSLTNSQLIRHHSSFNLHLLQSASYFRLDSANIMIHVLSRHLLFQPHWILNMIHFLLIITLRSSSFSTSTPNFIKALSNLASLPRFLFYVYLRLFLLFYLVLPQAQGARLL